MLSALVSVGGLEAGVDSGAAVAAGASGAGAVSAGAAACGVEVSSDEALVRVRFLTTSTPC